MRLIPVPAALFILAMAAPSFAQGPAAATPQIGGGEWVEYTNREDKFIVNFPGQPTVRTSTWAPQRGTPLPTRIYAVQDGARRYSVTVVNLAGVVEPSDVKGSISWEAWNFRKRGGEITYDAYAQVDRIEGHQIHITNRDKTLSFVGIYLHARRLYVLEATVPQDSPGAVHFQQSLYILDEQGNRVRYELDSDGNRKGRVTDLEGV